MKKYIGPVLIGTAVGGLFIALVSAAGTMAGANEQPLAQVVRSVNEAIFPAPLTGELLKLGNDQFLVAASPEISLTPTATSTVRKIGYGKSQIVTISTTTSGIYSSDGLRSPHFRYPGIDVLPVPAGPAQAIASEPDELASWSPPSGWVATPTVSANSFVVVTRSGHETIINGTSGHCVIGPTIALC